MLFYDQDPKSLPDDGHYFFNILMITVGINPKYRNKYLPENVYDTWYIDKITEPRPYAVFIFVDDSLDDTIEIDMKCTPHTVLEISKQLGISWFRTA